MPVIIRHGPKEWSNGKGPHDDPPIIEIETRKIIKKTVYKLVNKKQIPLYIVSSPYLRTLQTSYMVQYYLCQYGMNIEVYIDNDLSEHIKGKCVRVMKENKLEYIMESETDFNSRINRVKNKDYFKKNVWIITHRPIINKLIEGAYIETGKFIIL